MRDQLGTDLATKLHRDGIIIPCEGGTRTLFMNLTWLHTYTQLVQSSRPAPHLSGWGLDFVL